jgi:hypothetical protein
MDFSIVWWVLGCVGLFGLAILGAYLLKKFNINTEDLTEGIDIGKSIVAFASRLLKTMNIDETKFDIEFYSDIIFDALDYAKSFGDEVTKEQRIFSALDYINDVAESFEVTLSHNDIEILHTVITLCFNMQEAIENSKEVK